MELLKKDDEASETIQSLTEEKRKMDKVHYLLQLHDLLITIEYSNLKR